MWFLLIPQVILTALAVVGAFVAAQVASGLSRRKQWLLYGALLAGSFLPLLWHYQTTMAYASGYGAFHPDEPVGFYPGLKRFRYAVPAGAAGLYASGWLLARKLPLLAAALPGVAFVAYYRALSWVGEGPALVVLDNKPNIFLFMCNAAAVLGLAIYALAIWGPRGRP